MHTSAGDFSCLHYQKCHCRGCGPVHKPTQPCLTGIVEAAMKSRWGAALVVTLGLALIIAGLAPGEAAQAQTEPASKGSHLNPERNGTEHGFQSINLEDFGVSQYINNATRSLSQLNDLDFADQEPILNIYPVGDSIGLVADNSSGNYWVMRYEILESGTNPQRELKIEKLVATNDGGFVALASVGSSSDRVDAVIKADTNGALQWTRQFNRVGLRNIVESSDGYIAVGTNKRGAFNVISLEHGGEVEWQRELKRQNISSVGPVVVRPNGNIIIGGYSYQNNFPFTSPTGSWIVEMESSGDKIIWENTTVLGIWGDRGINSIQLLPNGDLIYGAGFSSGYYHKALLGRVQSDGTLGWARIWPEAGVNPVESYIANSIELTNDGVLLAGSISDLDGVGNDIWFIEVDQNGNLLNQFQVGGAKNDFISDMRLLPNGNIIVLAGTDSFFEWSQESWLFEITQGGEFKWGKVFKDAKFNNLDVTSPGDLILSGKDNTIFKIKPDAEIDNCNALTPSSAQGFVDFETIEHSDVSLQWETPSMTLNESTATISIPNVTPSGVCVSSYSITGKITMQDGTALQGVTVSAGSKSATTNASGNYTISGLATGNYTATPSLSGHTFAPASRSVTVPPNGTAVDFTATSQGGSYAISGKVTMQNGTPLQGVVVSAGFGIHATTNAKGEYTINNLSAGAYDVGATQTGFTFAPINTTVPPSKDNVNLVGVSEYDFDTGFRPRPNGFGFDNGPGIKNGECISSSEWQCYPNEPANGDFTWLDMQRMFGDDKVCMISGAPGDTCTAYHPLSVLWHAIWNRATHGGHCVGLAATSLRIYQDTSRLPPGFVSTFDLPLGTMRREATYFFVAQDANPIKRTISLAKEQSTPNGTLSDIRSAIQNQEEVVLFFEDNNPQIAHVIVPYALDNQGNGIWHIRVYDNEFPARDDLFIVINESGNTWSYSTWQAEGDAGTHSLFVVPLDEFNGILLPPWQLGQTARSDQQNGQVWLSGNGHLLLTDTQGRRIGYLGQNLINEIPDAEAITIFGGASPVEPIYEIPLGETYTITLNGQTAPTVGTANLTQFGPGYGVSIEDIPVTTSTKDLVTIAQDGTEVVYQATNNGQPDIALIFDDPTSSQQFEILGADVGSGQTVSVQADLVDKWLIFDSENSKGGAYNLAMTIADTSTEHKFNFENIQINSGDTHYIDFLELEAGGPVYLGIDVGSDGTLDDYFELEETTSGGIYLPVILRPSDAPSQPPLSFVYPQNGQTLNFEGDYLFKVIPYPNAEGYLWGFFQNGQYVWENMTEEGTLDGPEYAILSGTEAHNRFRRGAVEVWVRASINENWTEPTIITIYLE